MMRINKLFSLLGQSKTNTHFVAIMRLNYFYHLSQLFKQ